MNSASESGGGDHQIPPLLNGGIAKFHFLFIGGSLKTRPTCVSFFPLWVILASHDLLFISKLSSIFSKTFICLPWHLPIFWESFGSENGVIKEITSLDLFTCSHQVFMNNYPGGCIPQLGAGSLIGKRSHLEIHDSIRSKKDFMGDKAWLKVGLGRSILFYSEVALGLLQVDRMQRFNCSILTIVWYE